MQMVPLQPDSHKLSMLLAFLCAEENNFPAYKYNLSLPIVTSSHLVLFLSKLVGYLRMKIASHRQTVRKYGVLEPFGV